jgi:hypothetical protein
MLEADSNLLQQQLLDIVHTDQQLHKSGWVANGRSATSSSENCSNLDKRNGDHEEHQQRAVANPQ